MIVAIYADIIFLINFFVNGSILYMTGILRRKRAKIWRLALGAAATALFYTLTIFTPLAPFLNIFTSFVILAPGIFFSFSLANIRDFSITLLISYVCAFAMGGIAMVSVYILDAGHARAWSSHSLSIQHFSPQNILISIAVSFALLKFTQRHISKKILSKQVFCRFKIYLHDGMVELNALVDTGNNLIDPISLSPVIVAEFDKIKSLLPPSITAKDFDTRIRMIPYSSIGKSGVMTGFRPDKIEITQGSVHKEAGDVIIGICDFALSKDGEYQALMNPLLIG